MAVSGDVHDVYLPNLIHLICIEKRTAVLRLERRGENALIYFDEGDIVHALSSTYKLGTEAFYHVLGWDSGTFHLQLGVPVPRKTIKMSCAKLLINAVDRIDSKPDRDAKEMAKELTPEEIVRDTYLENELIVLMSVLENMQSRFSDQKILSKPEKLMELLAGMVNEIAVVLLYGLLGWKIAALYLGTGLLVAIICFWVILIVRNYILIKPLHTLTRIIA